ncbi:MAG: hypothetical protein E6Q97_17055 [Desulfurellales bacterium]|nr:MAG: hypothetical protein E6Q97_17055 [Desulfurellales bacterium]
MARTVTVSSIVDQIRKRSDIEAETDRFPQAELALYVSQSWCELYNEIVLQNNDAYLSSQLYNLVAGTDTYALPADFYLERGVDFTAQGYTYTLARWQFEEREMYQFIGTYTYGMPTAYRVVGSNLVFKPVPQTGSTARLWYYPAPVVLDINSSVDGVAGFEEFLVCDGAYKVLEKDQRQSVDVQVCRDRALAVARAALAGPSRSGGDRVIHRYGIDAQYPRRPYPR